MAKIDPIALSQELIRCPSITPKDEGALGVLEKHLTSLGFSCERQIFEEEGTEPVDNLYAKLGDSGNNLCFGGHTDVVPIGDEAAWTSPPFEAAIKDDILIGRGAVDMKCAIACFIAAISNYLEQQPCPGTLSLLITGDEEGISINGTKKMLKYLQDKGETIDACIVGEPTNPTELGEMIKIGRRGSVTFTLTVHGTQGHVAYPLIADNPVTRLVHILHDLKTHTLDEGNEFFQPTNLEITTVDVGNSADNVIPAHATAQFNIRFNDQHTSDSLTNWVHYICEQHAVGQYNLELHISGEAFITEPGPLSDIVVSAVEKVTGKTPELSTSGGTSDARFIKDYASVVECGMINRTAHKVDEQIGTKDIIDLTSIYQHIITKYFS